MRHYKDITGQKFGRLTVLEFAGRRNEIRHGKNRDAMWRCRCECGNGIVTGAHNLKSGNTVSCGCYGREQFIKMNTTHGESKTRLYTCWEAIIQRTKSNVCDGYYPHYGSKGITVCDEWKKYENFAAWARANGYRDDLTIDRIDADKGYYPENCRWATYTEQNNHLSRNRYIEIDGDTKTLAEWARHYGIVYQTVCSRIYHRHWDVERALTEPVRRRA